MGSQTPAPPAPRQSGAGRRGDDRGRARIARQVRAADIAPKGRRARMRRRVMAEAARLHCTDEIPDHWELPT